MRLVEKITLDRNRHSVSVDGEPFPYYMSTDGPRVDDLFTKDSPTVVWIPIICRDLEVLPENSEEC